MLTLVNKEQFIKEHISYERFETKKKSFVNFNPIVVYIFTWA